MVLTRLLQLKYYSYSDLAGIFFYQGNQMMTASNFCVTIFIVVLADCKENQLCMQIVSRMSHALQIVRRMSRACRLSGE